MQTLVALQPSRPPCPDLEPECFELPFCEAWRCAVTLRCGLTGDIAHCPICGIGAAAQYPDGESGRSKAA